MHLTSSISSMMEEMLVYTSREQYDSEGLYMPCRFVRRPQMKWDHYLKICFLHYFPDRISEQWSRVITDISWLEIEPFFIDFCVRDNDVSRIMLKAFSRD